MTAEISVFCFVYIHDNHYRVKTKTVPRVQHYRILLKLHVLVEWGSNCYSSDKIINTLQHKTLTMHSTCLRFFQFKSRCEIGLAFCIFRSCIFRSRIFPVVNFQLPIVETKVVTSRVFWVLTPK